MRFWAGVFLVVLVAVFLACKPTHQTQPAPPPKVTVTFTTDANGKLAWTIPPSALDHTKGDLLEWRNNSVTDVLVCMKDPDPPGRAFVPTSFAVPVGTSVPVRVRSGAKPTISGKYEHEFYPFDALSTEDCSGIPSEENIFTGPNTNTLNGGITSMPRTITVQ